MIIIILVQFCCSCWQCSQVIARKLCSELVGSDGTTPETKPMTSLQDTVGFPHVDAHVTRVMITWIGGVVEETCKQLLG